MKKTLILTLLVIFQIGCRSASDEQSKVVRLRVGLQKSPSNALLILTKLKGFYDSTKIQLELVPFEAGKLAYQDLLSSSSSLELAVAAETPFVLSALNGQPTISVIGSVVRATNEARLVIVKDGSTQSVPAYFEKKRKIATSLGGSPEYAYWRMIQDYGIDSTHVERVGMKPSEMPAAIGNGVDGVVVFDPAAYKAAEKLGSRGATFVNRKPILTFYNLYAREASLSKHPAAIAELLAGLLRTQAWLQQNAAEAQPMIASYTGIGQPIVKATWPSYDFTLRSPSAELDTLCVDEARWAKVTGKSAVVPTSFKSYFNSKPFEQARQLKVAQLN